MLNYMPGVIYRVSHFSCHTRPTGDRLSAQTVRTHTHTQATHIILRVHTPLLPFQRTIPCRQPLGGWAYDEWVGGGRVGVMSGVSAISIFVFTLSARQTHGRAHKPWFIRKICLWMCYIYEYIHSCKGNLHVHKMCEYMCVANWLVFPGFVGNIRS